MLARAHLWSYGDYGGLCLAHNLDVWYNVGEGNADDFDGCPYTRDIPEYDDRRRRRGGATLRLLSARLLFAGLAEKM